MPIAEKWRISETDIFGGKWRQFTFLTVYFLDIRLYVNFNRTPRPSQAIYSYKINSCR